MKWAYLLPMGLGSTSLQKAHARAGLRTFAQQTFRQTQALAAGIADFLG